MAALATASISNAAIAFYSGMKFPIHDRVDAPPDERTDLGPSDVPVGEVLFEMGAILAAHLAVALCVVLVLRLSGVLTAS